MEFRLTYKGTLPAESRSATRVKEKQLLRKEFHRQLAELWNHYPALQRQLKDPLIAYKTPDNQVSYPGPGVKQVMYAPDNPNAKPWLEHVADNYARCGYRFVPLVRRESGFTCSLDILFLRRDSPGQLVHGGDIDNRIKVLFDGLKMPNTVDEVGGFNPDANENPFFCLLEDDSLISGVTITTDRLLRPKETSEHMNDVFLVIHVKMADPEAAFLGNRLI